jgi:hypothetical protein
MATYIADLNSHALPMTDANEFYIDHFDNTLTVFQSFRPEKFQLVNNLRAPDTINYEISTSAIDMTGSAHVIFRNPVDNTSMIGEYRTGWLFRQGWTPISAGLHTMIETEGGSEFASVGGQGWDHYFERRQFPFNGASVMAEALSAKYGLAYEADPASGTDIAAILNAILNAVFAKAHSWPIGHPTGNGTFSLSNISKLIHFDLPIGDQTFMSDIIYQLSEISPGFDYETTWDMIFNIASPYFFGDPTTFDITDPTDSHWSYVLDGSDDAHTPFQIKFTGTGPLGTHVAGYGDGSPQMAVTKGYAGGQAQFHRLDASYQFSNISNRNVVDDLTSRQLSYGLNPVHELPVSVLPNQISGFWTKFRPGKAIYINYDLDIHMIASGYRIISTTLEDTEGVGEPIVQLGLNEIYDLADNIGTVEG